MNTNINMEQLQKDAVDIFNQGIRLFGICHLCNPQAF